MSVSYISRQSFFRNGSTLKLNMPGLVFVMFRTTTCPNSAKIFPHFENLASYDRRYTFCVVNVDQQRDIISMSNGSSTPILKVPLLILYANGDPKSKYNGSANGIQKYLNDMYNHQSVRLAMQNTFTQQQPQQQRGQIQIEGRVESSRKIEDGDPFYTPHNTEWISSMKGALKG